MAARKPARPPARKKTPTPEKNSSRKLLYLGAALALVLLLAAAAGLLLTISKPPQRTNPPATQPTPYSHPELIQTFDQGQYTAPRFRPDHGEVLFLHTPLAGATRPNLTAFSLATGKPTATFEASAKLVAYALSPDGKWAAVAENDGGIDLLTADNFAPVLTLPGHTATPVALQFAPDSRHLLTVAAGEDTTAMVWALTHQRAVFQTPRLDQPPADAAWLPDSRRFLIYGVGHTATLWDFPAQKQVQTLQHPGGVLRMAVSPDGHWIVIGAGGIDFWNADTGKRVHRQEDSDHGWVHPLAISPDSRWVAEGLPAENSVRLWQLPACTVGHTFYQPAGGTQVEFSPDSGSLLARAGDGSLQIFDLAHGTEVCKLAGPGGKTGETHFSPDGRFLISTGRGGAKLWQFRTP